MMERDELRGIQDRLARALKRYGATGNARVISEFEN